MSAISCEQCGKRYKVNEQLAGQTIKCPGCGASLVVPPLTGLPGETQEAPLGGVDHSRQVDSPGQGGFGPKPVPTSQGSKLIWWVVGGAGAFVVACIVAFVIMLSVNRRVPSGADANAGGGGPSDQAVVANRPPSDLAALPTQPKAVAPTETAKNKQSTTVGKPAANKKNATPTLKAPTTSMPPTKIPGPNDPDQLRGLDAELKQVLVKPPSAFEKVLTLKGHSGAVVAVALTPDASRAVTCSDEGDCRCWDLKAGKEVSRYEKKLLGKKFCVAITPDGKHALVGGEFKAVYVWDTHSGKHVFTHTGPPPAIVTHVDVSADGKRMAMLDKEAGIFIYPTLGGQGHTMHVPGKQFSDLALNPKGEFAVVATRSARPMAAFFPTKNTRRAINIGVPKSVSFDETYPIGVTDRLLVYGPSPGEFVTGVAPRPDQPPTEVFVSQSRLERVALIRVSKNEEFSLAMDNDGRVEIRSMPFPAGVITYDTQAKNITALGAAGDGRTIAYGHASGEVSLWRLPTTAEKRGVKLMHLLDRYILRGDYDSLEAIATRLRGDPKKVQRFPWDCRRTKLKTMVDYLATDPSFVRPDTKGRDERIKEWLAAHPESVTAKLIQAQRLKNQAWSARGSGFANTVTKEGWRVFGKKIEEARKILVPLADSDAPPLEMYSLLFDVAKAQSWEREMVDRYLDKLMKTAPTLSAAHLAVAQMYMRRWGGELGESADYALGVAERIGGGAGDAEYAKMALKVRRYFRASEFIQATKFDVSRMFRGFAHLAKTEPEDSEILQAAMLFAAQLDRSEYPDRDKYVVLCLEKLKPLDEKRSLFLWRTSKDYQAFRNWALKTLPQHRVHLTGRPDPPPSKVVAPKEKRHEPPSPPVSVPGTPVDLLRVIDPRRDAVKNECTLEDNKLSWRQAGSALLQIPFVPPAEYDLIITAARLRGNKGLMIGMIGSGHQFMFVLDDAKGSGLHRLDGKGYSDNESNNSQKLLTVGAAPKTIICEVRRNSLRITCGKEKILDWQGDFGRTALDRSWEVPDAKVLFIGGNAVFEITKLQLVPRQPPGKLADVPTPQEQQKAEQQIKQALNAEFVQASSSPQQVALAQKLLERGLADATEAAERFVLLREAKDLAIEAGSPALALIVAEQIERRFRVNARAMRAEILRQLAKATMPAAQRKELVESLIDFSQEEVTADNYDVAADFAELAFEQASRSRNVEARKQAVAWRSTIRQFHAWWNEAQAAQKVLAEKPDDPAAAAALGLFLCAVKRDWKTGLPRLANGSDDSLRATAQRDLSGASDPTQQVELADAWYATAKTGQAFDAFRHRAVYYYCQAYHDLAGAAKKRVATRIASLSKTLGPTLPRLDLADGPPGRVRQFLGHAGPVRCVAFAPHQPLAWSGSDDGTIRLWDLRTGKTLRRLEGHASGVWCLALTSDGKQMISGGQDSHYRLWDVDSDRLLATYRYRDDPKQFVRCLSLSPDNSRAVVGGAMNRVDSLKAEQRQLALVQAMRGPSGVVHALAFLPDGRRVVAGDNSGTLRVFDLENGVQEKTNDVRRGEITSLAVTADGSQVLWAGRREFSLGLWDVKANQEARSLDGHTATVRSVAIVPSEPYAIDGPYGVSGGDDGTIRVWKLDDGREVFRFPAQDTPVHAIAVSPDGRFVLSGRKDGNIRLWRLPRL